MNIVQISDTHFGTERPEVERALISALNAVPPDTVLLTGDITQRARRRQFECARRFLAKLPAHDLIAIPGNHDVPLYHLWRRLFNPYHGFKQAFKKLEVTRITDACTIIAINTTCPMKHKDGVISHQKIAQVAKELQSGKHSRLRIVAAHHPTAVVLSSDRENLVKNAKAAIETWSAAGMDLVLGGHIHYPFMAPLKGHYPQINTQAWVIQAGTAVSRRVRNQKSNSFNRIVIEDKRETVRIEQWSYQMDAGRFELVEAHTPWAV